MTRIFPPRYTEYCKGHGRIERRTIQTSTKLNHYLDFPYVGQVCRITRITTNLQGENRKEYVHYGITSLTPDNATPEQLLHLARGHWHIENRLHWIRDVTFDEDRSQVRKGAGPRVMASLRNAAIGIFRLWGYTNIARATRTCHQQPALALELIGA